MLMDGSEENTMSPSLTFNSFNAKWMAAVPALNAAAWDAPV